MEMELIGKLERNMMIFSSVEFLDYDYVNVFVSISFYIIYVYLCISMYYDNIMISW